MDEGEQLSIGELRKNTKTKIQSPDWTGKIQLQRHLLKELARQMNETKGSEVFASATMRWDEEEEEFTVSLLLEKTTRMSGKRKKRSTGKLTRIRRKSTLKGTIKVQRYLLKVFAEQMNEIEGDALRACIAGWQYGYGPTLHFVFELSPYYPSIAIRPEHGLK